MRSYGFYKFDEDTKKGYFLLQLECVKFRTFHKIQTTAEGVINFKTKNDMLTWKMNVTGANDATGVNIHKGKAGEKGEIVVDLMKVSKHSDNVTSDKWVKHSSKLRTISRIRQDPMC